MGGAVWVNGLASLGLLVSNMARCHTAISTCPVQYQQLQITSDWLQRHLSVFAVTATSSISTGSSSSSSTSLNVAASPLSISSMVWSNAASTDTTTNNNNITDILSSSASTSEMALPSILPCLSVYGVLQLFAFALTMHVLWCGEYLARLKWVAGTEAVDVEWRLETMRRPPKTEQIATALELMATLAVFSFILTALVPELVQWKVLPL